MEAVRKGRLAGIALAVPCLLFLPVLPASAATPGSWQGAWPIETDNAGSAAYPQVAVDASGNALAVWYQSDGTRYNIWANRFVVGSGWGTAALIETDDAGSAFSPQVAVDASGNALAVWYQSDGTRNNIWANRFVLGSGWGTAALIETDNAGSASNPQVALDSSGNAVALWHQWDGTRANIWANRYVTGSGWGTAALIETDNAGTALDPQVALDTSGNAVAVWYQYDGIRYNIWANRYVAGSGWGTAALIETDNAGHAFSAEVALDTSGNAVAVWYHYDGPRTNIWANRFVVGSGWGTAALIETDNVGDADGPQVAVDSSGNAIAVWHQSDGTRANIWANRFVEAYPPALSLTAPAQGSSTNRSTVWVEGQTEPGAAVSVDGVAALVAADGSFGLPVALAPGANVVVATARDAAGNSATASVTVTYEDPVTSLEQQLAAAQASLTATQADLAAARADLSAAEGRVAALEAETNANQTELDAARSDLATAQARIAALETDLGAAKGELATTLASLNKTAQDAAAARAEAATAGESALSASGQASLATALAAVGIAVGLASVAVTVKAGRKPPKGEAKASSPPSSRSEPPP